MTEAAPPPDRSYLLGTHDEEIARLGLQHRVWQAEAMTGWRAAGFTEGSRLIDVGAGPGWATTDLARIVGKAGEVLALERSDRFLAHLAATRDALGLDQIKPRRMDLMEDDFGADGFDGAWIRWVLAFLPDPTLALKKLAGALKPGGALVIHEYVDWQTFRLLPEVESQRDFVDFVLADWRASGTEPDISRRFGEMLPQAGFRIEAQRPIVWIARPDEYTWRWPHSFIHGYLRHLVGAGKVEQAWADRIRADFDAASRDPNARVVTPLVMETIARRV
ncbi:methyltransferase domain-containing protein [Brevundimonas sp. 2R-24]|uniref:Methyltransferase domain-containing protein n=1 Tax=Peiella sedimenti TaxID=3061083 RepID=A0ABT8SJH9_9CAUL|nr:methyltransferase domain-containing protein [Caulobacteraceae bacterium XZ-24]